MSNLNVLIKSWKLFCDSLSHYWLILSIIQTYYSNYNERSTTTFLIMNIFSTKSFMILLSYSSISYFITTSSTFRFRIFALFENLFDQKWLMLSHWNKCMLSLFMIKNTNQFLWKQIIERFFVYINYDIFSTTILKKKLFQQYVDLFQIIEKIDHFVYRLVIFENWRVHFVFIIAQLKSVSSSFTNFFNRFRFIKFDAVFVKNDIDRVKFYEMKRFFDKRQIACRKFEYFVKWKSYDFENDAWKNISKLNDIIKLIQKYEINHFIIVVKRTIKFFKNIFTQIFSQQKLTVAIFFKSILRRKKASISNFLSIQSKIIFAIKFSKSKFNSIFDHFFATSKFFFDIFAFVFSQQKFVIIIFFTQISITKFLITLIFYKFSSFINESKTNNFKKISILIFYRFLFFKQWAMKN